MIGRTRKLENNNQHKHSMFHRRQQNYHFNNHFKRETVSGALELAGTVKKKNSTFTVGEFIKRTFRNNLIAHSSRPPLVVFISADYSNCTTLDIGSSNDIDTIRNDIGTGCNPQKLRL